MDFKLKTLATLLLFFCLVNASYGQCNLTFNSAEFIELEGTYIGWTTDLIVDTETITIPAGQVWKIESAAGALFTNFGSYQNSNAVLINMNDIPIAGYGSGSINPAPFPIWLKPGTYKFELLYSKEASQDFPLKGYVSALIFNN